MTSHIYKKNLDPSNLLIITDLDGTLLDFETYSFEAAKPSLQMLNRLGVPVICCSSKTSEEIRYWRRRLRLKAPFISENGAAVFLGLDQFGKLSGKSVKRNGCIVKEFGLPSRKLRQIFERVRRETGVEIEGFSDMKVSRIQKLCGFKSIRLAKTAAAREYSEPFIFPPDSNERAISRVLSSFKKYRLKVIKGNRFFHLVGDIDKGRAVRFLKKVYNDTMGTKYLTIGLGDGVNDIEMLKEVDIPVLVMGKNKRYNLAVKSSVDVIFAGAPGPDGWQRAIDSILVNSI